MKSKIIMLLSLLLLCGMEAIAQADQPLTRLTANDITDGKRIMIRRVQYQNRQFFNGTADRIKLPTVQTIFKVEKKEGEDNKILLKREFDGQYLGANGTSFSMVEAPTEEAPTKVVSFKTVTPNRDAINNKDELGWNTGNDGFQVNVSKLVEDKNYVRFVASSLEEENPSSKYYLNLMSVSYGSGQGVWSIFEVYEVGTPVTAEEPEEGSDIYLLRNVDGKVLTANEARQGSTFALADYEPENKMQQWIVVASDNDEVKLYNVGSGLYLGDTETDTKVLGWSEVALAGSYTQNQDGEHSTFSNLTLNEEGELVGGIASEWQLIDKNKADGLVDVVYSLYYNDKMFAERNYAISPTLGYPEFPKFDWVTATTEKPDVDNIESSKDLEGITYDPKTDTYKMRVDYVFNPDCPVKNSDTSDPENVKYEWSLITLPDNDNALWHVQINTNTNGATFCSEAKSGLFDKLSWFAFELEDPANSAFRIYSRNADDSGQKIGANPKAPAKESRNGDMLWSLSANGDNWSLKKAYLTTEDTNPDNVWWSQGTDGEFGYGTTPSPLNFVSEEDFLAEYIDPYKFVASLPEGEYLGLPNYEESKTIAAEYDANGLSVGLYTNHIETIKPNEATVVAGKYYRIVNAALRSTNSECNGQYAMLGTVPEGSDLKAKGVACSKSDAGLVWRFDNAGESNENEEVRSIYNPSAQKYLAAVEADPTTKTGLTDAEQSYVFTYEENGKFLIHNSGSTAQDAYLNMESNADYINGWNENDSENDNARWYIAEATTLDVELKEDLKEDESRDYWTSIFLPFAVEVGNGVTIYGAKDNGTSLKLNQVDGQTLDERQGVLLNGSAAQVTLSILSVDAAGALQPLSEEVNDLTGYTQDKPRGERTVYALSKQGEDDVDGILAFYKYTGDTLPAYKAYVVTDSGNAETLTAKYFDFGTVTGIDAAPTTSENTAADVYDLSGRRVSHAGKGLYIVGGRKVIR